MLKTKKLSSALLLVFGLVLGACGGGGGSSESSSSHIDSSTSESTSESSSGSSSTSVEVVDNYEQWINSWSEPGHLYIHYNRPGASESEYNRYAIWIWQNAPQDLEGTLWGASSSTVQALFYEMSTSWMTNITPEGGNIDQHGRIMDIDLTRTDLIGGKTGKSVTFDGATRVGFLIIEQDSMDGGSHWTSDGGADTYIPDFQTHWRENGSMHIFCTRGSVASYTFEASDEVIENPTIEDTTGQYRSSADLDSSKEMAGVPATSKSFKELGVGYQIFVASFRDSDGDGLGDLRGIINSLDYLEDLGVQVLWLTPIQESGSYHGYDVTDFYTVDSKFGTIDDYRELIYEAHQRGMKVLMDLVINHTSKNNIWFTLSQRAEVGEDIHGNEINYRNLYHWKYKGDKVQLYQNGTYVTVNVEDHPNWYRDGESNYYYYGKFGSSMAELNYDSQATRDFVVEMAQYWLSFGLDGFRLDAVKHIYMNDEAEASASDIVVKDVGSKTYYDDEKMEEVTEDFDYSSNMTKNVNFWKSFAYEIKRVYPDAFLVGENFDGYGHRIAPYYQALDSQFDFSLYYHNNEYLYGATTAAGMSQAQAQETYDAFSGTGTNGIWVDGSISYYAPEGHRSDFINSPFTSNHDTNRAINHVNGDKAKITGTSEEVNRAKVHAASTLLSPGISWIYYGDELGMSGNTNTHVATYGNENNIDLWYRQPFKWGDNTETDYTFNSYEVTYDDYNQTLKSAAQQAENANDGDMLDFYKELIEIKTSFGQVKKYTGYYTNDNTDILRYDLECSNGTFRIYINCGANNRQYTTTLNGSMVYRLNGTSGNTIPAYGVAVVKV